MLSALAAIIPQLRSVYRVPFLLLLIAANVCGVPVMCANDFCIPGQSVKQYARALVSSLRLWFDAARKPMKSVKIMQGSSCTA